jgi:hypothetical protein
MRINCGHLLSYYIQVELSFILFILTIKGIDRSEGSTKYVPIKSVEQHNDVSTFIAIIDQSVPRNQNGRSMYD